MLRLATVIIVTVLLAVQVVRNAVVEGIAASQPSLAARVWSGHPTVEISAAMTEIAQAARDRRPVPASALATISAASTKEPLAPEPFLVRGVQAEIEGREAAAQQAFEAAQWRDPRSLPAAYFLAERYVRTNNVAKGLDEVAALARLSPNGNQMVAPYLAAFARNPSNWPALGAMFRANPELADPALTTLATDPATANAVMALADPHERVEDAHWLSALLMTLANSGRYAEARSIWARMSKVQSADLVYDRSFRDKNSPPPFNWSLTSSSVGLAERQPGGRLHVLFYGHEDGILATQLILLPPGAYRMSMQLAVGDTRANVLNWSIWCDKADAPTSSVTLDGAVSKGWDFTVPANCPAQWLRLSGVSGDISQQIDVTISTVRVEKAATRA